MALVVLLLGNEVPRVVPLKSLPAALGRPEPHSQPLAVLQEAHHADRVSEVPIRLTCIAGFQACIPPSLGFSCLTVQRGKGICLKNHSNTR